MKKTVYLILGHLFLVLGIVGAFVPVLPTTPFLLLSALLYSRSSPRIHRWMTEHKIIGKPIREWEESGVIRPWAKILATIMVGFVIFIKFQKLPIHMGFKAFLALILIGVLGFIWTRPNRAHNTTKEPQK